MQFYSNERKENEENNLNNENKQLDVPAKIYSLAKKASKVSKNGNPLYKRLNYTVLSIMLTEKSKKI